MNQDLDRDLERGPEAVAHALSEWRKATYERKKKEALLYAEFKGKASLDGERLTSTDIKHMIISDPSMCESILAEITAEAEYKRVEEKHLANKKKASLRTAY